MYVLIPLTQDVWISKIFNYLTSFPYETFLLSEFYIFPILYLSEKHCPNKRLLRIS